MSRTKKPPSYRLHKQTGQAVVTLNGRDHYLGKHGSEASREAYDRIVGEWLCSGRRTQASNKESLSVNELLAAYLRYAEHHYPPKEVSHVKCVMRALKTSHGRAQVTDFGPLALKAVRERFVDQGQVRTYVNDNVGRIKRIFRWGTENELLPASVLYGLGAVAGLRRGRTDAPEGMQVKPVPDVYVDAIRPHVSRQVWAIVELQRLTGMRSGEVVIMRGRDLEMNGTIWLYSPGKHKTEYHGHERVVEIGPKAQAVVRPFLKSDLESFLFSPADAETERREAMNAKRRTPLSCGNRPGTNRKRKPKRTPKERYTPDSYRRAITRACDLADFDARKRKNLAPGADRIVPRWHPHQLRHNYATMVRREFGIETARILLGHRSIVTTEIYAEADRLKAREVVAKIG